MSDEPTIDHLLEWFETFYGADDPEHDPAEYRAIRAILEQHREPTRLRPCPFCGETLFAETAIIRAFVERVESLAKSRNLGIADDWMHALYDAFQDVKVEAEVKE